MEFAFTAESLVAAYYLLTAIALTSGNYIFKAVAIGLCLLSRYSIVLWVPLYFLVIYFSETKKQTAISACILIGLFIIFYWFPFLRQNDNIFIKGYQYHTAAAIDGWTTNAGGNTQRILTNGLGFGAIAYNLLPGSPAARLHTYQIIHFTLSAISILIPAFVFLKKRKMIRQKPFLLATLKIYLTVFYCFIQIPFDYLFIVPLMITPVMVEDIL